jgi:hypothetical protein
MCKLFPIINWIMYLVEYNAEIAMFVIHLNIVEG